MVKLNYEEFVSQVDKLFSASKDKHSINFTFKRVYQENFKNKHNIKNNKLRRDDHILQESDPQKQFPVLVRAKLMKKRYQTIVKPENLSSFHNILMKIFSLHFILETNNHVPRSRVTAKKKKSNKQKRLEKKKKKLTKQNATSLNTDEADVKAK